MPDSMLATSEFELESELESESKPAGSITMSKACIPPASSSRPANRKVRFTMGPGPRADCVKCKMGVKGHWVHLD